MIKETCRIYAVLISALLITESGIAQTLTLTGVVKNRETQEPIEYVNIGIEGTIYGGASYEDGTFVVKIPNSFKDDSLTFSAIGYKKMKVDISFLLLNKGNAVLMEPKFLELEEIFVYPEERKVITDGNKKPKFGFLGTSTSGTFIPSEDGGAAMAILLNEAGRKVVLEEAAIFIHESTIQEYQLRIRFLNSVNGIPGDDLYSGNIIISSSIENGKINVDLSERSIIINEPFFLVFEWIVDKKLASILSDKEKYKPEWLKEGVRIENGNTIAIFDSVNKKWKKNKLSIKQQSEFDRYDELSDMVAVFFSVKKSTYKGFMRDSGLSSWYEPEKKLVAYAKYVLLD